VASITPYYTIINRARFLCMAQVLSDNPSTKVWIYISNLHCKVPLHSACSPLESGSMEKTYSPSCFPHPFEVLLVSEGAIQTSGHDTAELKADEALHPKVCLFRLIPREWFHTSACWLASATSFKSKFKNQTECTLHIQTSFNLELVHMASYCKLELHCVPTLETLELRESRSTS